MAGRGGAMPGAGRPKGSGTKPKLSDYFTEAEKLALVKTAKRLAESGDKDMVKYLMDQIHGKAVQRNEIAGDKDNPLTFSLIELLKDDK